jgi:serine/threonine-protein kinase
MRLMPLSAGQTFAGFRIVRLLGSGGMGEVCLAEHPRLPRRDALKVLPADVSADPDYRGRFDREADLASTLWHPHIVSVHDRGDYNGQLWISMDYIDGTDAARLMRDRYPAGMPPHEAVEIITAVAGALDYAHQQGLLHRDIKPANILLTRPDDEGKRRVFLADFGIARELADPSGLTPTNITVGTVAYAAPEQLMGLELDGRADQYALAATAFHLLTGAPPYQHSNPVAIIDQHLNADIPKLSARRPDLADFDHAMSTALAKNPDHRFSSCRDFAKSLREHVPAALVGEHTTQEAAHARRRPRISFRAVVLALIAVALVGTVIAVASLFGGPRGNPPAGPPNTPGPSAAPPPAPATTTVVSTPNASTPVVPSPITTTTTRSEEPVQPYALPGCYRGGGAVTERPTDSAIGCRHHFFEGLTWMSWGAAGAEGTGIEQRQNCNPSCAQGETFRNRVQVVFTGYELAPPDSGCPNTFRYYSQLIVAHRLTLPTPHIPRGGLSLLYRRQSTTHTVGDLLDRVPVRAHRPSLLVTLSEHIRIQPPTMRTITVAVLTFLSQTHCGSYLSAPPWCCSGSRKLLSANVFRSFRPFPLPI